MNAVLRKRPVVIASGLLIALALLAAPAVAQRPTWPTLEEQFAESRVDPESALARLIEENQQFDMLRPEEADDKIVTPPWLRVLWRKSHPDLEYSADDPSGGYPLVLKEIWEWMAYHQDLEPGAPDAPDTPDSPSRIASVGTDQRISGSQKSRRSESTIRVNYWNRNKILAAANNIQGSGRQAQFYSTDGGTSWKQNYLALEAGDSFQSDPTVEWTSDGTAWATTIGIDATVTVLKLRAYKSTDNGATWKFDATFSGNHTDTDKQMTWVDRSPISKYRNNIYAIWHTGKPVYMNRRTGPQGSWQTPVKVSGSETTGTGIGSDVRTNTAGEVFGFWPDTGSRKLFVVKSTDGGKSYGKPVQIARSFDSYDIGIPAMSDRRVLIYITAGAYRTAAQSMVFAAWADLTGVTGCKSASDEPDTSTTSSCKTRIWFARSTDGGATWSSPKMINDKSSKNDQFNPWMVVDETNGRLAIMYYDTVADSGRKKTHVYYQSSVDFGKTWSKAVQVTTKPTDETSSGADSGKYGNQYGDYNGLAGIDGTFFPSWTDRRSGKKEEIWTAAVTDKGGTGPDPGIRPWGVSLIPPKPPWWQSQDIWVDNDGDGKVHEPNEPSRGKADNKLTARITNSGSAAAKGYRVVFGFKPYTTNGATPVQTIASKTETGSLAPGKAKTYTVTWDLSDKYIQANFDSKFWKAKHFCVQVKLESSSASALDDVNPTNNSAQSNYNNVPFSKVHRLGKATFFLYNHLERPATASLEWTARAEGWEVQFENLEDPGFIPMQPGEWIEVEAQVSGQPRAEPPRAGEPVLVDVSQQLDGETVGGLTLALLPEEAFVDDAPRGLFASVTTGGNWPLGSMAGSYDPAFTFALKLERSFGASLRVGLEAGFHEFDAEPALAIDNLGVPNLSLYGRWLGSAGTLRPFALVGAGGYRVDGSWEPGYQAGLGLELPISGDLSLTAGATGHLVSASGETGDLSWIDGYLGFVFAFR